jgi:hypothetical protein
MANATSENKSMSMVIDGVASTPDLDSSGESLDLKGANIDDLIEGKGLFSYEHKGAGGDDENYGQEIVGKILTAKKIYVERDCETERHRFFWDRVRGPFLYIIGRLFDGAGHPGAQALAASIRDAVANEEPSVLSYSVEGTTLEKEGHILKSTIIRRVAVTFRPCLKTTQLGLVEDPGAPAGFPKHPGAVDVASLVAKEEKNPQFARLGGYSMEYGPGMLKAMTAGNYNVAPGALTGGAALQREHLVDEKVKKKAMDVFRRWDGRTKFREVLKAEMPEVSDDFIDHFSDIVERHSFRVKKAEEVIGQLAKAGKKPAKPKAPKPEAAPPAQLMIQGKPVPAPPAGTKGPSFDVASGRLTTKQGVFQASTPSAPHPHLLEHTGKAPQEIASHFSDEMAAQRVHHQRAMKNWFDVNDRFVKGAVPSGVVSHAVAFALMSPGTPVPIQEHMYSIDEDVILTTCDKKQKKIKDFRAGDTIFGVNARGETVRTQVVALHDHGILDGYEVVFDDGYSIVCSQNHKFLTQHGMTPLWKTVTLNIGVYSDPKNQEGWLAGQVRTDIQNRSPVQGPQKRVSGLQKALAGEKEEHRQVRMGVYVGRQEVVLTKGCSPGPKGEIRKGPNGSYGRHSTVGEGASRGVQRSPEEGCYCDGRMGQAQSGEGAGSGPSLGRSRGEMAHREPGSLCREYSQNGRSAEGEEGWLAVLQDGGVPPQDRNPDLGRGPNSLRGRTQAGGLCESGPQKLGGSGRVLPLLRVQEQHLLVCHSGAGRNAECGSAETAECDVDSAGLHLFSAPQQLLKAPVARMAYSDAPLASTGSLVLRRIVRVRSVGLKHMYDLEVSHPKHNFLLSNGVVTSNSHFVDALHSQGLEAPGLEQWGATQKDWMARNRTGLPQHSQDHFKALEDQLKAKTGAFIGFNKPDKFSEYFGDYLKNDHNDIMKSIADAKGDAHVVARRFSEVRGIGPKLARYLTSMMGGGNMVVPDTHFLRHYFGGRPDAPGQRPGTSPDSDTMDHLKGVVLGSTSAHDLLEGMDKHYFQNHDAVKNVLNDPTIGPYFKGREEQAIFPAFWHHWISIPGHEGRIGIPNKYASNEGTDHAPFWDAVRPLLNKAEGADYDPDLHFRTAMQHHRWVEKYGAVHALGLYYRYLAPKLMENDSKKGEYAMRKCEALQVELLGLLRKAAFDPLNALLSSSPAPRKTLKRSDGASGEMDWQGEKVIPGRGTYTDPTGTRKDLALFEAGPKEFVGVPKEKLGNHQPGDLVRIPRNHHTLEVHTPPQKVGASKVVSVKDHGVSEYMHPESAALAEGFDFGAHSAPSDKGSRRNTSFWSQTPSGQRVYVKGEPGAIQNKVGIPEARQEAVYGNLARSFFGLGQYVPTAALVRHPVTGIEHAIIAHTPGEEYDSYDPAHAAIIKSHGDSGEIDKMHIMDKVMANSDRSHMNYLVDPKTNSMSLIDHNLVLDSTKRSWFPEYSYQYSRQAGTARKLHPEAIKWLNQLDPDELETQLRKHEIPDTEVVRAGMRLREIQALGRKQLITPTNVWEDV